MMWWRSVVPIFHSVKFFNVVERVCFLSRNACFLHEQELHTAA